MRTDHSCDWVVWVVAVSLALGWAASLCPEARAQESVSEERPAAAAGADVAPATDVEEGWTEISIEELEAIIKRAEALRLADERQKAIDEIRDGLLYDEQVKDAAEKMLTAEGAKTQQDNIERISKAFAKVDGRFGRCLRLFADGDYAKCAEEVKQTLVAEQTNYHSVCKHYLYAEALAKKAEALHKASKLREAEKTSMFAADAYVEILRNMPERISFASVSAVKAGQSFEAYGRNMNAMKVYAYGLKNYGLTLSSEDREKILAKVEAWEAIYRDPMRHLAGQMGKVETRLKAVDSGAKTQKTQRQIVMVLEDLIKTAEENQGSGRGQGQQRQKGTKKGQGQCQGQGQGQGRSQGRAQGTQQPSSPAREGFLPAGAVVRPGRLSQIRSTAETGDWAELPPRERDKLREIMKKVMSERYRSLVSDYRTSLSEKTGR